MEDIEDIRTIGGVTKDGDHHSGRHAGYENAESHWSLALVTWAMSG